MKIFETAGFCVVAIAAKRHAADQTFCPPFVAAHCTSLLAFVLTTDRDMPQAFFQAHRLESIVVIIEELLLICRCLTSYLMHLVNLLSGEHPIKYILGLIRHKIVFAYNGCIFYMLWFRPPITSFNEVQLPFLCFIPFTLISLHCSGIGTVVSAGQTLLRHR